MQNPLPDPESFQWPTRSPTKPDGDHLRAGVEAADLERLERRQAAAGPLVTRGAGYENTNRQQLSVAIHTKLDPLKSSVLSTPWGQRLLGLISRREADATTLPAAEPDLEPPPIDDWAQEFRARLDRLDNDLREMRERCSLRPS